MKRTLTGIIILSLVLSAISCKTVPEESFHIDSIKSYRDIPGVTQDEIDAIEALKDTREILSYGQMFETEAFILPDGAYAGFAAEFCDLLSDLFDIQFVLELYEWEELKNGLDSRQIDFTGDLTPTTERMRVYYMTHPIAERAQRIFTLKDAEGIMTEKDVNGLNIGFLENSIDDEAIIEAYPELTFKVAEVDNFADAAEMLKTGEIDAFVSEGVIDPLFDAYGGIRSREFFPLVYTPVSLTTANPELKPIITVVSKYIAVGGIDKLFDFYKKGNEDYARYKLNKSFTEEERTYLSNLAMRDIPVQIALEQDNYPVSFYNSTEGEFQGIAVDVLKEISKLTGIQFETANDKDTTWAEILEMLRKGEVSAVSQLLYSAERENDFLWTDAPYASTNYALLSKADYPNLASYQVVRTKVGVINQSAFADKYNEWYPDNSNTLVYDTQNEALDALETGEIDLLMGSEYMLLMQLNYREKPGYKINVRYNVPMDSYFGLNINEKVLCAIVNKAQACVQTDLIASDWTSRGYDYSKKLAEERLTYLIIIVAFLILILIMTMVFLLRNRKFSRGLEEIVKKRTHELEQQTQAAQVASKAKGAFLARMSHEIRTPLNAIVGMAGIARNSINNREKAILSIDQIISSSQHLLSILNDVLDMSKIESGKLELSYEPFSLLKAYGEVSAIIEQRCTEKNIKFTTNMDENRDITLIGDKLRINQVLINLLGNAVKFTDSGGKIDFSVHVLEESDKSVRLCFSISDSGIGMSDEQITRLFIPFEQADNTIAAKFGGTGLGLSISQNLVGMMGGVIQVESRPGDGSRFYFELCFNKGEDVGEVETVVPDSINLKSKRILLVEDIAINRTIICEILSPTGVEIEEAENGEKAIEVLNNAPVWHYDLIFMDIQMPVMDGYEATRRIRMLDREDAKNVPIIAMTANAYKEDVLEAFDAGMNAHLSKPVDINALMGVLMKFIILEGDCL